MWGNSGCNVYIGNLDERVNERVLYDILIQAGRVVDLYIPRDKETDRPKGFAFVEYETQEIADYAIKLFSGIVTLYNRTLKFAKFEVSLVGDPTGLIFCRLTSQVLQALKKEVGVDNVLLEAIGIDVAIDEQLSGQDKNSQNSSATITTLSSHKSRSDPVPVPVSSMEISHHSMRISALFRVSANPASHSSEEPPPPGVTPHNNGYGTHLNVNNFEYSRRVFGATMDSVSRPRSRPR